jgi:uncharacterized protein YeaO (DUF488 family)
VSNAKRAGSTAPRRRAKPDAVAATTPRASPPFYPPMSVRIVRLGTDRRPGEGLRIGTVRRPPRGVPKADFARHNWYDVWYPVLAPSAETVKLGQEADTGAKWAAFLRKYRSEMAAPDAARSLDLLAALSHHADFSVGCYCEDEARCHRSVLRRLLEERGARVD